MDFLGNEFASTSGTKDASVLKDKIVGIYFSAHWCPPCRSFTPKLVEFYNKMQAAGKPFEIIFASSDQDEDQFKEYFAEMPWLALPFSNRSLKNDVSKKFKVSGIPMFVILDTDGSVITTDGRTEVMGDFEGENFPWRPKPTSELLGSSFVNAKGETFGADALAGKYVGVYFSAHWCPPCRGFTPDLATCYNNLKAAGKPFELIFCSSDRDQASFDEYLGEMPWLAMPFKEREQKEALSKKFGVQGIPMLVILDNTDERKVVNDNARSAVGDDLEGANFPWVPPPLKILPDGADQMNDETCFIALLDGCDDDDQEDALKILDTIASEFKAKGDDMVFCAAKGGDPLSPQIRKLTKMKNSPNAQLIILDIPDEGGFHVPNGKIQTVTDENVREFIQAYKDKTTTRQQLAR